MQFSTLFLATAAATLASAVKLTNPSFEVTAGTPFNITWADADGPVTLVLKDGPSTALTTVSTIGSGLTGTSYSWTPSSSLSSTLYAIEITDSTDTPNYSVQFQVSGATAAVSSATASSTGSSSGTKTSTSDPTSTSSGSKNSTSASSSASSSTASSNLTTTASSSSSASKTSSLTTSASKTSSSTSSSGTATSAPTSAAVDLASPLAFVFLAFAAIVTLN